MTLTIDAGTDFDTTLPLAIPDPAVGAGSVLWRFDAAALPGTGSLSSWAADLGSVPKTLTQSTAANRPTVTSVSGRLQVNFDGGDSLTSSQTALATELSTYLVVRPTARSSLSVVASYGGFFVALNSSGAVRVGGASGSVTSAATVPLNAWTVIAVTLSGTTASVTVGSETIAAPPVTAGTMSLFELGTSGTNYFTGAIRTAIVFSVAHTASQVATEIADLKTWNEIT